MESSSVGSLASGSAARSVDYSEYSSADDSVHWMVDPKGLRLAARMDATTAVHSDNLSVGYSEY